MGFGTKGIGVVLVTCIINRLSPWSRTCTIRSGWRSRSGFVKSATLRWALYGDGSPASLDPQRGSRSLQIVATGEKEDPAQQVRRFHDQMAAAERFGAVDVQLGQEGSEPSDRTGPRSRPELLARHVGRPVAPVTAQPLRSELLPVATAGEP
jgi:hypothetical protein